MFLRSIDILSLHGLVLRSIEEDFAGVYAMEACITGANFVPQMPIKFRFIR
jgi:hypothetical protein